MLYTFTPGDGSCLITSDDGTYNKDITGPMDIKKLSDNKILLSKPGFSLIISVTDEIGAIDGAAAAGTIAGVIAQLRAVFPNAGAATVPGLDEYSRLFKNHYVTPQNYKSDFFVFASAILRPTNAYVYGTPITWGFIIAGQHGYSFFKSVQGIGNQRLEVSFPLVKNVFNVTVAPDESFVGLGIICGPTVGLSTLEINVTNNSLICGRLRGQGSTAWQKNGDIFSSFDITAISGGGTSFNVQNGYNVNYEAVQIIYIGTNNYGIRRVYSGLGAYNIRFILVDRATGLDVTTNPTSSDEIIISNAGVISSQLQMATWGANNSVIGSGSYNFWLTGLFETYLIAETLDSDSVILKWQKYSSSATAYKIYRSTSLDFSGETLIFTGGALTDLEVGVFKDTGLTSNTTYYYRLKATVSGSDVILTDTQAWTY